MHTVLFDLDGTLLPMDMEAFLRAYLQELSKKGAAAGYNPVELVEVVMDGVDAMVRNDGTMTNEERFWELFISRIGGSRDVHQQVFEEFYLHDFPRLEKTVQPSPLSRQAVEILKDKGYRLVLATNPFFPRLATLERMRWAGVEPEDFALITTFENCHFAKPHPGYYRQILEVIGAAASECLMVGNDMVEDLAAAQLGLEVFLVTDNLINPQGADYSEFLHGSREDLAAYLAKLPDRK